MLEDTPSFIQRELSAGEKLIWSGQPRTGVCFRKQDALLIPFSLIWGGFAVFWEISVFRSNAPIFFRLWGIPFVLVGIYLIIGRFFVDAKQREKTFYAVTNSRIIIFSGLFSRNIRSLNLKALPELNLDESSDGSGTILFGPIYSMMQNPGGGWPASGKYYTPAFEMIKNVRQVYDLVRRLQSDTVN